MTEEPSDLATAHAWLDEASHILDLDPATVRTLAGRLLDLTREVAHNHSRPAAPLTAFLVGLASHADDDTEVVAARVEKLIARIAKET